MPNQAGLDNPINAPDIRENFRPQTSQAGMPALHDSRKKKMRTFCILVVLCTFGCSKTERPTTANTQAVQDAPSEALDDLVFVDMFAPDYATQHPLIGRSSGGQDMAFKHVGSGETIHAVFPKGVSAPEALNGRFALQGHYQVASEKHTKDDSPVKMIPKGYRYFVVSSWTIKK